MAVGFAAQSTSLTVPLTVFATPACEVNVPVVLDGWHLVVNAFCPFGPVMVRFRVVSVRSGMLLNVTVPAPRLTLPTSVSANGAGNVIVIVGALAEPPRTTVPLASATFGTSGEVAEAVPTLQPAPVPRRQPTSARQVDAEAARELQRDRLRGRLVSGLGDR